MFPAENFTLAKDTSVSNLKLGIKCLYIHQYFIRNRYYKICEETYKQQRLCTNLLS